MDLLTIVAAVLVLMLVGVVSYAVGHRSGAAADEQAEDAPRLEEYDFYPFVVNADGHVEFDTELFNDAVGHLLAHRNERAATELIVIGEQNLVRDTFPSDRLRDYKRLYAEYDGDEVVSDNDAFLENYKRIVNQLGRSFRHTGIEVLLHNLVNPAHSLVAIENGVVTGRSIGSGATNLVLDLKTRRRQGQDKVNYELNIGSRQFKCTTIPIFRRDFGLVGAICVNVDTQFIKGAAADSDRLQAFLDNLLRTDFQLDENILSKDEYQLAIRGKRHYRDEAVWSAAGHTRKRKLAAILFSDIVGFTSLMGADEAATMAIIQANEEIHLKALSAHRGQLLKKLGDGILACFDTASGAVEAARKIQRAVAGDGRFQVRIGIHLGEIIEEGGDVHGDGVNIASRIQEAIEPGQVGFSKVVYDNTKNKEGLTATLIGERNLKNVEAPVILYSLN